MSAFDHSGLTQTVDFSYGDVEIALGESDPEPKRDQDFHNAADLLRVICVWLADSQSVHSAGLRALAMSWVLRPRAFKKNSVRKLAKTFGVTRQSIVKYASELHRLSHGIFTGPTMRKPSNRRDRSRIAIQGHKLAGHKLHGNGANNPW
jgi:hypothetical protein